MRQVFLRYTRQSVIYITYQLFGKLPSVYYKPYSTSEGLNLSDLDRKWRRKWQADQKSKTQPKFTTRTQTDGDRDCPKKYILPMFPYPSGDLHLGHLRVYTISDVLARFYRMSGFEVIHPIGWDAFGLPAENAAIDRGIDPKTWTKKNIDNMKTQLENMNGHWDWDREFATCDPSFYKHTQKLFTLLHKNGLAYQAESLVNYDPIDQTVLANEQVDINGYSWRSGAKVEKRTLKQWFLRISEYRQELLDGLKFLKKEQLWPQRVLAMQENWLGKSSGAQVKFPIIANDSKSYHSIEVFTTRLDTLFGVQFLALAPTHPMVENLARTNPKLQAFLDSVPNLSQDSKVGYELSGFKAVNPLSYQKSIPESYKDHLPIFVAPYVLGDYGYGAVMGVPGHDVRDYAFWQHNRSTEPVRCVITEALDQTTKSSKELPFTHHGFLTSKCGPYSTMSTAEATGKILAVLLSNGHGSSVENWRLRDWLVSRQRYWGTPIPIVHCNKCGPIAVPDDELPVELPPVAAHWGNKETGNPLENASDWVNTKCPSCGSPAKRETDTMDTFVDSSWYFLRFLDPSNVTEFLSLDTAKNNLPVDIYVGGIEHAILHLLYARFIYKFMSDTFLNSSVTDATREPFKVLLAQGMVHGKTYTDPRSGQFLKPSEVNLTEMGKPLMASGQIANVSFEKMSKSKHNGVDPNICREKYGTDALRAHILFQAPITEILEWHEDKIVGVVRWLRRLYDFINSEQEIWIRVNSFGNKSNHCARDLLTEAIQILESKTIEANPIKDVDDSRERDKIIGNMVSALETDLESIKKLWRAVQGTIVKVTNSYDKTHALNTVVSDLMTLTNTITESPCGKKGTDKILTGQITINQIFIFWSLRELIKMMAPITPAFAEECWMLLDTKTLKTSNHACDSLDLPDSVFSQPFPRVDGTFDLLTPATQPCAVQINGRLKLVVEIPPLPENLNSSEIERWITNKILDTAEGRQKLMCETHSVDKLEKLDSEKRFLSNFDIRTARRIIVVKKGKTVNYVM
ncbi:Leucine--tRNA ligase, mitochondrial [Golovinomyces cichoracearum]|uniref:leucine--tRNA ligase n=1 Tax=Golovinomyces cichoracearum TaxID=62708 RepID=A0A420IRL0_9PEZI|nr:Leucine--tRNA ligase, mitochondrial [Golovinomyces cichoracearum]